MGKYYKIALAFLYVLQLIIVFKNPLIQLYRHTERTAQKEESFARPLTDLLSTMHRVWREHRDLVIAAQADQTKESVLTNEHGNGEDAVHAETKRGAADRTRRRTAKEYVIINLYPGFKKESAKKENAASLRKLRLRHAVKYPAAAGIN